MDMFTSETFRNHMYPNVRTLSWSIMFGYIFLIFATMMQVMSFAVVCLSCGRLPNFLRKYLKRMFAFSFLHYLFRFVYEVCHYTPFHEFGMLCWTLRACMEVFWCCSMSIVCLIAGYYNMLLRRQVDPEHVHDSPVWRGFQTLPVIAPLFPVAFYAVTYRSDWLLVKDSCWTGEIFQILNGCQATDHLIILCILLAIVYDTFYNYRRKSCAKLQKTLLILPDWYGKVKKMTIFLLISLLCEVPIQMKSFAANWTYELAVVISWSAVAFSMAWCCCFLDRDIQDEFGSSGSKFEIKFSLDVPESPKKTSTSVPTSHNHLICKKHRRNNQDVQMSARLPEFLRNNKQFHIKAT